MNTTEEIVPMPTIKIKQKTDNDLSIKENFYELEIYDNNTLYLSENTFIYEVFNTTIEPLLLKIRTDKDTLSDSFIIYPGKRTLFDNGDSYKFNKYVFDKKQVEEYTDKYYSANSIVKDLKSKILFLENKLKNVPLRSETQKETLIKNFNSLKKFLLKKEKENDNDNLADYINYISISEDMIFNGKLIISFHAQIYGGSQDLGNFHSEPFHNISFNLLPLDENIPQYKTLYESFKGLCVECVEELHNNEDKYCSHCGAKQFYVSK